MCLMRLRYGNLGLFLTLSGLLFSGCFSTHRIPATQRLAITTSPPNAFVWQQDDKGKRAVGRAPLTYRRDYERVVRRFRPWPSWLTLLGMTGLTAGGFAYYDSHGSNDGGTIILSTAIIAGVVVLSVLAPVIIGTFNPESEVAIDRKVTVGASMPGFADAWTKLAIPAKKKAVHLSLPAGGGDKGGLLGGAGGIASVMGKASSAATPKGRSRPIVAVFAVDYTAKGVSARDREALTEYLATQLTASGKFRVIPRSQVRQRLTGAKKAGYKVCYDEACQIELGKALAAQKSLATKILKVGKLCATTSVLYDLKTETSERAATSEGPCTMAALLSALRAQATKLATAPQ